MKAERRAPVRGAAPRSTARTTTHSLPLGAPELLLADLDHDHQTFSAGVEYGLAQRRAENVAEEVAAELHCRANAVVQALASLLPHEDATAARRGRQEAASALARGHAAAWPLEAS